MLNEPLYKALKHIAGDEPAIIAEDEHAVYLDVRPSFEYIDDAETRLQSRCTSGGEQYAICCPFCGDKRHRLYFSHMWNRSFIMYNSKYRASDKLCICFNENCLANGENFKKIATELNTLISNPEAMEINLEATVSSGTFANQVSFPEGCQLLETAPPHVKEYIESRGFTLEELTSYFVQWLPEYDEVNDDGSSYRKFNKPILVIPVMQNNEYWFWQGRLVPIEGQLELDGNGEQYPKYYNKKGCKKSWSLYNIDQAHKHGTIYVVEGVTDVWSIGLNAVAKFGSILSRAQCNILGGKCANRDIVLVPDMNDPKALGIAFKERISLLSLGVFRSVTISKIPDGYDVGMLKQERKNVCQIIADSSLSEEYIHSLE